MLFEFPWFEDWVIPERTFLPFLVIFFLKLDETAVFWFVGMICCLLSFWYFGEEQSMHVCVFWEGMSCFLCVSGLSLLSWRWEEQDDWCICCAWGCKQNCGLCWLMRWWRKLFESVKIVVLCPPANEEVSVSLEIPRGASGGESACQRRGRRGSWVGKIPWRRKWQLAPALLPGKSHGQRRKIFYQTWWWGGVEGENWMNLSIWPDSPQMVFWPTE